HLPCVARDLEDQGAPGNVDDAGPEVLSDLPDLDPVVRRAHGDLDEHQLAVDVLRAAVVDDGDDVDELLQLLLYLLYRALLAGADEGRAAEPRLVGLGDRERLDVVAAPCEETGDAQQHPWAVAHRDGEDVAVLHQATTGSSARVATVSGAS